MNKPEDQFDRSLNAALASLPQLRPSAAFSSKVMVSFKQARRAEFAPAWPFAAALAASSALIAAGAMSLTVSIPRLAVGGAKAVAVIEAVGRLALHALPSPRAGAEFSAAALLAAALFLTISMPRRRETQLIGAKS